MVLVEQPSVPSSLAARRPATRDYAATMLLGLLSATLVTVGLTRPWVRASGTVEGLPHLDAAATGADLAPLAGALGVVLLASFGAVLATRGSFRRVVGFLIVGCAVAVGFAAVHPAAADALLRDGLAAKGWTGSGNYRTATQLWRWLVLGGALGCLVAGLQVVRRAPQWPTMGRRYDAPDAPAPAVLLSDESHISDQSHLSDERDISDEALWRALDEGRDPTRRP